MNTNKSATVRTVSKGSPFTETYDLVVEVLVDGKWTYYQGFNTLSNDYAYSEARAAENRAKAEYEN
jgi:hypothetical protein